MFLTAPKNTAYTILEEQYFGGILMCAIAGFVGRESAKPSEEKIIKIKESMHRRGPDENGLYNTENCLLIHSRLAVIDIENGKQPMSVQSGETKFTIVYNGEIYNTDEVRNKLKSEGVPFTTRSDTEVILKGFIKWGEKILDELNGIFAFAIWNEATKELFVARDRCGVKPFFYSVIDGNFIFASEMKTLFASGIVKPRITKEGISDLMLIAPGRTPGIAVFEGVNEIKPGFCGYFSSRGLRLFPYWKLEDKGHPDSLADTVLKVNHLVRDAVHRQLVSDVPIGTYLSGGLDSSLISSIANRYMRKNGKRLITFSVGYKDNEKYFKTSHFQPNSDEKYIRLMCDYLDCDHVDVTIDTEELADALKYAVEARDLPGMADVDSSLLLFCKEIKKHVTVALSGECADELFGGYPWYRDKEVRERYGFPWSNNYKYRAAFINPDIRGQIDADKYVSERYEKYCREAPKAEGLSPDENRMREMSYLNIYWFMQTLLDRKDRMSMYSGLEVRVPFCDHRIAEYMYSTPFYMKDLNGYEKGLLRAAFDGYLPPEILWRKKSPYPKTHNPNYMAAVSSLLAPILDDNNAPIHKLVDKGEVRKLFNTENPQPWYGQLMTTPQTVAWFYMLNYWLEKHKVEIDI